MPTTIIPIGTAFTLTVNIVYATGARSSLYTKSGAGTIEWSNDNSTWTAAVLDDNGSFFTSALFLRSTGADSVIVGKQLAKGGGGSNITLGMLSVPVFEYPIQPQSNVGAAPAYANLTINTADDRIACIFRATKAGQIRTIYFRTGTVTTGATVDVRVETVSLATGDPSGSLWAANTNGACVIAGTDDDVTKSATLTANATVAVGDLVAIVIVNPAGSPGNLVLQTVGYFQGVGLPYHDFFDGATWAKGNASPTTLVMALEYSDGSSCNIPGIHGVGPLTTTTFASGSTPDTIGARFRLPVGVRVIGARVWANLTADATLRLVTAAYNQAGGTGILASMLMDTTVKRAANPYLFPVIFGAEVELTANTYYRLIIEPGASNVSIYDMAAPTLNTLDSFGSQEFHLTTAKDPTGDVSWTNFNSGTFRAPYMGLMINGVVGEV